MDKLTSQRGRTVLEDHINSMVVNNIYIKQCLKNIPVTLLSLIDWLPNILKVYVYPINYSY